MRKSILLAFLLCFLLNGNVSADIADGVFIMKPKSNKAYFYNNEIMYGKSFYKNRKSGSPYVAGDGNVYISAKRFFEAFGDGNEFFLEGDSLILKLNGKKCALPIGKKFAVRNHEDEGEMYVYAFSLKATSASVISTSAAVALNGKILQIIERTKSIEISFFFILPS